MPSTNWSNQTINSTGYTKGTINSTTYGSTFTFLLLNEDTVTLGSSVYDLRGLLDGTNLTYSTNWT